MYSLLLKISLFAILLNIAPIIYLEACTGIKLIAKDNSIVHGRTLEFGIDLDTSIAVVPRGHVFTGTTPLGPGMSFSTKYGTVGVIAFDQMAIMDGINEKGLSIGTFYFPDYAGYAEITADNQCLALSPIEFPHWILSQFATIEEVRSGLSQVLIAPTISPQWGTSPPPFHYIVFDKKGNCLVIEPVKGKLVLYDNKLGILTNSPSFTWHMTNLRNFIHLTPWNAKPLKLNGLDLSALGQGSGMIGIPGDFTPPSRFIRATLFSQNALRAENADKAIFQVFHILNQFDIPLGIVREEKNKMMYADHTSITCARDPQSLKFYFRTYDDPSIRVIDLNQFNLEDKNIKRVHTSDTDQPTPAADISSELE